MRQIGPSLAGGGVAAVWALANLVAYCGLVCAGPLAPVLPFFLTMTLLGFALASGWVAGFSGFAGMASNGLSACVAIDAAVAAELAVQLAGHGGAAAQAGFLVLVTGGLTASTGLALFLLGRVRLGVLARLLPYPVMSGYMAGLGWLFLAGGFALATGLPRSAAGLTQLAGDRDAALRLLAAVALAALLVWRPWRLRHWSAMPLLMLGGALALHAVRLALGADIAQAQGAGWLLGPFPASSGMPELPAGAAALLLEPAVLMPLLLAAVSSAFLAAVSLALFLGNLEAGLHQSFDLNRELRVAGLANLLGGAVGAMPAAQAVSTTLLLHQAEGGSRLGAFIPAAAALALIAAGPAVLDWLPRFVPAALLLSFGFERLALRTIRDCRVLPAHEAAMLLAVGGAVAVLGILGGLAVGLALAVALFAWSYRGIPVVRSELPGSAYHSRVLRSPEAAAALGRDGDSILAYRLQGYLFFLNADGVVAAAAARAVRAPALRLLVLEFRDVVGMDSSAVTVFWRLFHLAEEHGFEVALTDLAPALEARLRRSGLLDQAAHVRVVPTADLALEAAENRLLAANGGAAGQRSLAAALAAHGNCRIEEARLRPYARPVRLAPGEVLMRSGEDGDAMFFVESGAVAAELPRAGGPPVRLVSAEAGAVLGELALITGSARTATVVAEAPSVLLRLDGAALRRMDEADPDLARLLQGFVLRQVADRLVATSRLLDLSLR